MQLADCMCCKLGCPHRLNLHAIYRVTAASVGGGGPMS
jgi:hypothetical protein